MPADFFQNHIIFSNGLFTQNLENKCFKSPFICFTENIIECITQGASVKYKQIRKKKKRMKVLKIKK